MILEFILSIAAIIIGLIIGGYILFAGRRRLPITLAFLAFTAGANLLAVFVAGVDSGLALIDIEAWSLLGIALGIGVVGFLIGKVRSELAVSVIGFIAGAELAVLFIEISDYLTINVFNQSEQTALWVAMVILVIGGLLGFWFVRASRDEALILITMIVGVSIIQVVLGLSTTSSWSAIFILTLALAGLLVQYALYIREIKEEETIIEPQVSSVAYFQDLELE